jgi:Cu2+-containing amine oxidase
MPDGEDTGSFCGVSVDDQGSKLTLTTNVQAGWYRYILKWNFYPDGSFHPEGWFGAIPSSCVQNPHVHMIYFRIDMDIQGDTPNVVEERNTSNFNKPNPNNTDPERIWVTWDPIIVEMPRMKQRDKSRWWRIRNTNTDRAYLIYPPEVYPGEVGEDEVNIFAQLSDIWFLKYNSANQEETNDGGSFNRYWAHLGQFINDSTWPGNNLQGADSVVWYSGGMLHMVEGNDPVCHDVQGPWFVPDPEGPAW